MTRRPRTVARTISARVGSRVGSRVGLALLTAVLTLGLAGCSGCGCGYDLAGDNPVPIATPSEVPASGEPTPAPSGSVAQAQGERERIFECSSDAGGHSGAKIPEFTIDRARVIVEIMTYHYDYNAHKLGTIALKNTETGETFGPWETTGAPGQGGVENAYWLAHPNVEIPAGTYQLVDSSPSTWFTNSEMKGFGGSYVDALK